MVKLGNIRKVGENYVERTTGRKLTTREVNQIIPVQRAQGKMASPKVQKSINTVAEKIAARRQIGWKEAKERAHDRIETLLVDREYHEDEEDYEEMEWTP